MAENDVLNRSAVTIGIGQGTNTRITGAEFRNLRENMGLTLSQFGLVLRQAINPKAQRGYTRQYIERLEKGKDEITPRLTRGYWNIHNTFYDNAPAGIGGATWVNILAARDQIPDGAYLPPTAKAIPCARPGCTVVFIQDNYFRKYHHPDCREAHKRQREREAMK